MGGAFVAIGHIPGSELVAGQVDLHDNGYVKVAEPSTRTNLAGVFAIGDLVDFTYRQAVTAAGSGTRGALDAEWYLRDTPPTDAEKLEAAEESLPGNTLKGLAGGRRRCGRRPGRRASR